MEKGSFSAAGKESMGSIFTMPSLNQGLDTYSVKSTHCIQGIFSVHCTLLAGNKGKDTLKVQ